MKTTIEEMALDDARRELRKQAADMLAEARAAFQKPYYMRLSGTHASATENGVTSVTISIDNLYTQLLDVYVASREEQEAQEIIRQIYKRLRQPQGKPVKGSKS